MHEIRKALRGRGTVLMGKNTMVRRAVRILMADFPEYERLLPFIKGMLANRYQQRPIADLTRQRRIRLHQR
jgi:large subunit ribosomal protein LP0